MRLKLNISSEAKHEDVISCVAWSSSDQVLACSDDHTISKNNLISGDKAMFCQLPKDVFPLDMSRLSGTIKSGKHQSQSDLYVVTSSDGKFHLISNGGRIEKSVEAHKGAVLSGKWSYDGSALVTAGEDGKVKIWSRSGMLRSTMAQVSNCIYCAVWSPDSDKILYTSGKHVIIQPLQPSEKTVKWKAHEGIVLKLDWSIVNNLILTGGEDCKYKVWDTYGRPVFSSSSTNYPITSLSWSPDGDLFAVGFFNSLLLCDKSGWSHGQEYLENGSVLNIAWSNDGTQVAGACADGQIITAHCIDKRLEWAEFQVALVSRKTVEVKNVADDSFESLEMRDRVIKLSMGFNYLIAVTSSQCLVYSTNNFNTPQIFELRNSSVSFVQQTEKIFLLVDSASLHVYSYEGRHVCSPKLPGTVNSYMLNANTLSLSNDVIAIRDGKDEHTVLLFDATTGKSWEDRSHITHAMEVVQVTLSQWGNISDRFLAIIDKNQDVYMTTIRNARGSITLKKLSTMVQCLQWNTQVNMLCGLRDSHLMVWFYPNALFVDNDILPQTQYERDCSEFGKNLSLVSYNDSTVSLRCADGSNVFVSISPYPKVLHQFVSNGNWNESICLCRFAKESSLWTCLAAMALKEKNLETAEVAYAAIGAVDKVEFLNHVKSIPNSDVRAAKMSMFCGNQVEAESTLLRGGFLYLLIRLNMDLYEWEHALDLAIRHKTHVDTVLGFRQIYLEQIGKEENNNKFKQYSENVVVDWDKIETKIESEMQAAGLDHM